MTMPCPADQAAAGTGIAAWITNRGTSVRVVGACSGATVNASQIPDCGKRTAKPKTEACTGTAVGTFKR